MWHYCIKIEFQKIVNFLDTTSDDKDLPKFITKKCIKAYDQSEGNYDVNKEIRMRTSMLRSDICDFNDAYIVVKGDITVGARNNAKKIKAVAFKINAPFINWFQKLMVKKLIMQKI